MKETPNIITSKDLLYIEDMLNWNYTMIKKINVLIECVEEEEVLTLLKKACKMHNKHYNSLLSILE